MRRRPLIGATRGRPSELESKHDWSYSRSTVQPERAASSISGARAGRPAPARCVLWRARLRHAGTRHDCAHRAAFVWQSGACPTTGSCSEWAKVDLGSEQAVGALYIKSGNDEVDQTTFERSLDGGVEWTLVDDTVPPQATMYS